MSSPALMLDREVSSDGRQVMASSRRASVDGIVSRYIKKLARLR